MAKPKCPHCGKPIVRFPIKANNGRIQWENLFRTDLVSILFLFSILLIAYGYSHDVAEYKELAENPCDYIEQFQCTMPEVIRGQNGQYLFNFSQAGNRSQTS